jgi:excisionase family DNA binding protein
MGHVFPEVLLRTEEVSKRLGVSVRTVLSWADRGLIPSTKTPGGHRRYPAGGVEEVWAKMTGESSS